MGRYTVPTRLIVYTRIVAKLTQITAYFGDKKFQLFGVFIDSSAAPWHTVSKYIYMSILNSESLLQGHRRANLHNSKKTNGYYITNTKMHIGKLFFQKKPILQISVRKKASVNKRR